MDAQHSTGGASWPRIESPCAAGRAASAVVRLPAATGLALLAAGAILFAARRWSGALIEPLPPTVLAGWGALLALAALAFRRVFSATTFRWQPWMAGALWAAPSAVVALWAGSLSLQGSSGIGLAGLWGLLLVEEGWSWGRWRQNQVAPARSPRAGAVALAPDGVQAGEPAVTNEAPEPFDEDVTQQIVRRRQSDHSEALEGWVRAELAAAQRHATAHIAICPPLDSAPERYAEQTDGPPATVQVAQALPFGVRFDIKLDKPAREASSVVIEFSIQSRPAPRS